MKSFLAKKCRWLLMGGLLSAVSGCAAMQDNKYEFNQQVYTACAWSDFDSNKRLCVISAYSSDYKYGWKAGFYSVITGGECRPPVIPPKKYWHPPLLLTCNDCGCEDWYDGFRCGARVARHQPDHHYVRPWLSSRCPECQPTDAVCQEPDVCSPGIRLLTIEPIETASDLVDPAEVTGQRAPASIDSTTELTPNPIAPSGSGIDQ